jgi:hypothetical protein
MAVIVHGCYISPTMNKLYSQSRSKLIPEVRSCNWTYVAIPECILAAANSAYLAKLLITLVV